MFPPALIDPPTRLMDRLLQKEKKCLFAAAGFFSAGGII
jgi:hypothetical protein